MPNTLDTSTGGVLGSGSNSSWWTRPLSPWVDAALSGALFAFGCTALAFWLLAFDHDGLESTPPWSVLGLALVAIGSGVSFVWFFGPVYQLIEPPAAGAERSLVKVHARMKTLAVGNPLAWLAAFAAGTAPILGMGVYLGVPAGSALRSFAVSALLFSPLTAALAVGVYKLGPGLPAAARLWSIRIGRSTPRDTPAILSGRSARAASWLAVLLMLIVYALLVSPSMVLFAVQANQQVSQTGYERLVSGGSVIALTDTVSISYPENWEGVLTWDSPSDADMGLSRSISMQAPDETMRISFGVPNELDEPRVGDPEQLISHKDTYGDRLVGPEPVAYGGWTGSAAWLTLLATGPGREGYMLWANLTNAAGETVYLDAYLGIDSELDGHSGPAEATQAAIKLVGLEASSE